MARRTSTVVRPAARLELGNNAVRWQEWSGAPRVGGISERSGRAWAARGSEDILHDAVVAEALSALSPAHREVLTETILRQRTVNEAADILDIPLSTVKARIYYALRSLRIVLEERGVAI